MRRTTVAILVVFAAVAAAPATATTYYVARNGNDTWNGRYATFQGGSSGPFLTAQRGADVAIAGDTVFIRTGTYTEVLRDWGTWYNGVLVPMNAGTAASRITFVNYPVVCSSCVGS